jgi:hypothetical protein
VNKFFTLMLAGFLLVFTFSAAWCTPQEDVTKELTKFYNDMKIGNVDDMTKKLTVETAKKVKSTPTTNVLGNLDQIFGIAQSAKNKEIEVYISGIKFEFPEVKDNKVVARTFFNSIIMKDGKFQSNRSQHEITMLKEQGKWYIMNFTNLMSSLKNKKTH